MAKYGFIHDKLDIKMLVLYLLDRAAGPISPDLLTELSLRHNGVEYFDLIEATAELVTSGHLRLDRDGYSITEKGRGNSAACESSLAYSVRSRCDGDMAKVNAELRRKAQVRGEVRRTAEGSIVAHMALDDEGGNLLTLELLCPSEEQARRMISGFQDRPEALYHQILAHLTAEQEEEEEG